MRKTYIYIIGMAMTLVPATGMAQGVLSPNTAIALSANRSGIAKAQAADSKMLSVFVTIDPTNTSWQKLGLTPIVECGNTATVRLSAAELKDLAEKEGVKYIQLTSGVSQMLDVARKEAGTDEIHKRYDTLAALHRQGSSGRHSRCRFRLSA